MEKDIARKVRDQEEFNDEHYDIIEVEDGKYGNVYQQIMVPDPKNEDDYKYEVKGMGINVEWNEDHVDDQLDNS